MTNQNTAVVTDGTTKSKNAPVFDEKTFMSERRFLDILEDADVRQVLRASRLKEQSTSVNGS
jgi:hypothetical protein